MDETELILKDRDTWWSTRQMNLLAKNCKVCDGRGWRIVSNQADDFDKELCVCQDQQ